MAIKNMPCGGFKYDDETVEFVDGVMKAKGNGGGNTPCVINLNVDSETNELTWDKTDEEMIEAYNNNQIIMVKLTATIDGIFGVVTVICTYADSAEGYGHSFVFGQEGGGLMYVIPDGSDGEWSGRLLPDRDDDEGGGGGYAPTY